MNKKIAAIAGVIIIGVLGVFSATKMLKNNEDVSKSNENTITIASELGNVTIEKNPERVVVFDVPTLDTMEELGIDKVVGVPTSDYYDNLEKYNSDDYTKVGSLKEIDLEAIKSLNPDLIIIGGRQSSYYDKLSEIAPTILMSKEQTNYLKSSKGNIDTIAKIFNKEDEVNEKYEKVLSNLSATKEKVNGAEALTVMVNEGNLSVYNENSRYALIYQELGFKNADETIEDSTHGQSVTFEYLSEINPEYLIILDRGSAIGKTSTAKTIMENDIVKSTDAYKNGKMIYLDSYTWYINDGGLNSLNKMAEDISKNIK
ncbi:siderophore ABC transporter substrate-binding protein [Peptacetobacter hiranonis]|uniref:siderophore ABC transporter substrate-binding protein n=1 Tax=Peptacetobacter hiranonis TaxID=89152 RepID=UPI002E77FA24|nr:ABC transporter substrate-binding protein [Peptacetobacter hiranonis]MEE0249041.1 ABC transporter substrate-binding protein [Peptacetobacter hiranonis]